MTIIEAIQDSRLFKPFFKDLGTWQAWLVYLRALFGLAQESAADRQLLFDCTGLSEAPSRAARESYVVAGRRSGKSRISAMIAVFLASFKNWTPYLSPGERGYIFIIAVDKAQAGIIKRYISAFLSESKMLRAMVERETKEEIHLKNRMTISIKTASFRAVRGYSVACAILEELAFYRSEDSANPDKEILGALRPALATIPESLLIGISSPYSRTGVLYDAWKASFGQPGKSLIWKAPTLTMNPTIDRGEIERAFAEDPLAAKSEWDAEWRSDISAFISSEVIETCIIPGRHELPRITEAQYHAFIDPSGGRQDSFTLAICHLEKSGKIVLDVLRERRPPFQPKGVVAEFSDVLRAYGCTEAGSDRYAGEWVTEAFREQGIAVKNSEQSASELYLEFLPLLMNGSVELLDDKRMAAQFAGLERRARAGGKDLITHYTGGHDDLCNAVAGACVEACSKPKGFALAIFSDEAVYGSDTEDVNGGSLFAALVNKMGEKR